MMNESFLEENTNFTFSQYEKRINVDVERNFSRLNTKKCPISKRLDSIPRQIKQDKN